MKNDTLSTATFLLLTVVVVGSTAVTDFRIGENGAWRDIAIRRFYGPWANVRKQNGDYADYNDYGAPLPYFEEISLDDEPVRGYPNDLPLRRSMGTTEFKTEYEPNPIGLAVFNDGVHPNTWFSKNRDHVEGVHGDSLSDQSFDKDSSVESRGRD